MSSEQPTYSPKHTETSRSDSAHSSLPNRPHFATSRPDNSMPLGLQKRMERLLKDLENIENKVDPDLPATGEDFLNEVRSSDLAPHFQLPHEESPAQQVAANRTSADAAPEYSASENPASTNSIEPEKEELAEDSLVPKYQASEIQLENLYLEATPTDHPPQTENLPQTETLEPTSWDQEADQPFESPEDPTNNLPEQPTGSGTESQGSKEESFQVDHQKMQPLSQVLQSAQYLDRQQWNDIYTEDTSIQQTENQYTESEEITQYRNWNSKPAETDTAELTQLDAENPVTAHAPTSTIANTHTETAMADEIQNTEADNLEESQIDQATEEFQLQASIILKELRSQQESLSDRRKELDQRQQSMDAQMRFERLKVSEKAREVLQKQKELEKAEKALLKNELEQLESQTETASQTAPLEAETSSLADTLKSESTSPEEPAQQNKTPQEAETNDQLEDSPIVTAETKEEPPIAADLEFALAVKRHVENLEEAPDNPIFLEPLSEEATPELEQPQAKTPANTSEVAERAETSSVATISFESAESNGSLEQEVNHKETLLKKQHTLAIQSMQQQKRRLQLLRSVLVQQQEDWGQRVQQLETERTEWSLHLQAAKENWLNQRQDGERFLAGQQAEIDQHSEMQTQREASLLSLEKKLNEAQIQVFRDQTVVKQISRAARKTLSNNNWSQLKEDIAREAEDFLTTVENQAREIHFQTVQHQQRLEKREQEVEAYRKSTQKWVERQNKLLSRRTAHVEQREEEVEQKLAQIAQDRLELQNQQNQLNKILNLSLEHLEDEISGLGNDAMPEAA